MHTSVQNVDMDATGGYARVSPCANLPILFFVPDSHTAVGVSNVPRCKWKEQRFGLQRRIGSLMSGYAVVVKVYLLRRVTEKSPDENRKCHRVVVVVEVWRCLPMQYPAMRSLQCGGVKGRIGESLGFSFSHAVCGLHRFAVLCRPRSAALIYRLEHVGNVRLAVGSSKQLRDGHAHFFHVTFHRHASNHLQAQTPVCKFMSSRFVRRMQIHETIASGQHKPTSLPLRGPLCAQRGRKATVR
jgi:hypothetical protein